MKQPQVIISPGLFEKLPRCPYRQDLKLVCFETCGKNEACDCPIWLKESGLLAYAMSQKGV